MKRRDALRVIGALGATGVGLRGQAPILPATGLDHIKIRVANAGASAMFYYGLFGPEVVWVHNSTLVSQTPVDEFFLKFGQTDAPYLMLSQARDGEKPGLDHVAVLAGPADTRALEAAGVSFAQAEQPGLRIRDGASVFIEVFPDRTWGKPAASIRQTLPANWKGVRSGFDAAGLRMLRVLSADPALYGRVFGPVPHLEVESGLPALRDVEIAVRNFRVADARRVLYARGIAASASASQVSIRDPDGNEVWLTGLEPPGARRSQAR